MRAILHTLGIAALAVLTSSATAHISAQVSAQTSPQAANPASPANAAPAMATLRRVYVYPLEAELVHSLDPATLNPGDHVLTKLSHVWTDGDCTLAGGATLSGEVVTVHAWTKADKQTRVTLQFRYPCNNDSRLLRLISLFAPEYPDILGIHGNPVAMQAMRSSLNGEGDPFRPAGNTANYHPDMSGQQNPQLPLFIDAEPTPDHRPTVVTRGMVWHLHGIGLELNDSTPPTTSIYASRRAFKLPSQTMLIMQPDLTTTGSFATPGAASSTAEPGSLTPRKQLAALAPEITACPAASCSELASPAISPSKPAQEFSLRHYGHLRGQTGEIPGLEYSAAVAFLSPDELLVCLGKPGLVQRTGTERPEDHPHLVQAVLYNRQTGRVERTAEWTVPNRERYLWPLAHGRILVHDGDRLVWFGPGLTPEHTLPLHAPLAFVHTTGNGRHLLVGTLRELHSRPEHAELFRNDSRAPEEQVQEVLYDDELHPVSETEESSRSMPPLLLDTGRITLRHRSNTVWYFRETLWSGQVRNFGTLTSSCVPQTTALSGDMLLVIGCETHSLNAWARVLRPDGSVVLHTIVHSSDLYPVVPAASPNSIVLVSPHLNAAANRDGALHAADIIGESVRVLRTANGRVEFSTDVHQPTTSAQPAAVDPEGASLAVLDGDNVRVYRLNAATASGTEDHATAF